MNQPKKHQVILKRQVTTKAVVTKKFKQFLTYELEENVKFYQNKVTELNQQKLQLNETDPKQSQLNTELKEAQSYISYESSQRKFIDDLEMNSLYSQGPVEGFVTVTVGDNLYEKLGGIEIIVEDGTVKEIKSTSSQFDNVTK